MSYTKKEKLEKGEGRLYEVRLNLGNEYFPPSKLMKHWRLSVDERGGYWSRLYRAKTRKEVVYRMIMWYRCKKNDAKKHPQSVFHRLPRPVDGVLEVRDDYNEVVFFPNMRSHHPQNRLLTPDKVEEIVKLSNGKFKKNTEFTKQGSFVLTEKYLKIDKSHKNYYLVKIPDVPYLYKHRISEKYYAAIRIGRDSLDQSPTNEKTTKTYYLRSGKKVSFKQRVGKRIRAKRLYFKLKSTDQHKAATEAMKLKKKYLTS